MNNVMAIYRKEVGAYFKSPMAYIFLVFFALFNGYFFSNHVLPVQPVRYAGTI